MNGYDGYQAYSYLRAGVDFPDLPLEIGRAHV